jgi:haloalkane dehalogenase
MKPMHRIVFVLFALFVAVAVAHAQSSNPQSPVIYEGLATPELPYPSRWIDVNGSKMHYMETGNPGGTPILLLHGQPTWSYLWRNVMPHLEGSGRVIALDLIGMGLSDKPALDYTFMEHREYLWGFIEAMELENIVLVIHDWGSALGFDYAANHQDNVQAIAFMEALVAPATDYESLPPEFAQMLQAVRTPGIGEELLINQNMFVEQILPSAVLRPLSEAELNAYRFPYPTPETRLPVFMWPNQVPIAGEPADVNAIVAEYAVWLPQTEMPMLHLYATPGVLMGEALAQMLQGMYQNLEILNVGEGLHFIQEDQPDAIGQGIADWLDRVVFVD